MAPYEAMLEQRTKQDQRSIARVTKIRKIGGYGAAVAVTPYLLIKVAWTFGLFIPTKEMDGADWRAINAGTVVLAAVGILLGMAFCRPWGERLPAWLVALPMWVGTGLLVPMLLLAPMLGPSAISRDKEAGSADFWTYEQVFVMVSLVGIGVFLPLSLAGYAKVRWPEALGGPTDHEQLPGNTQQLQTALARLVAAGCVLLGVIKVFWAAGGTLGLDPAMLESRDAWWHLLSLSTGAWAFAGAWGVLVLASRRGSRKFLPPMVATWVSSGMLFSYSLYNLFMLTVVRQPTPEYSLAHVLTREAGIVLGTVMGMTILLVLHDRRRALHGEPG